jgi:hypothetical protein
MAEQLAEIEFLLSDYVVRKTGDYVLCAVTGERIPLGQLRYWSAERQEAYASAEISFRRAQELDAQEH